MLDSFPGERNGRASKSSLSDELLNNRFLTSEQCAAAFPGLVKEIGDTVAKGTFKLERTGLLGPLVARISHGKVSARNHCNIDLLPLVCP